MEPSDNSAQTLPSPYPLYLTKLVGQFIATAVCIAVMHALDSTALFIGIIIIAVLWSKKIDSKIRPKAKMNREERIRLYKWFALLLTIVIIEVGAFSLVHSLKDGKFADLDYLIILYGLIGAVFYVIGYHWIVEGETDVT